MTHLEARREPINYIDPRSYQEQSHARLSGNRKLTGSLKKLRVHEPLSGYCNGYCTHWLQQLNYILVEKKMTFKDHTNGKDSDSDYEDL